MHFKNYLLYNPHTMQAPPLLDIIDMTALYKLYPYVLSTDGVSSDADDPLYNLIWSDDLTAAETIVQSTIDILETSPVAPVSPDLLHNMYMSLTEYNTPDILHTPHPNYIVQLLRIYMPNIYSDIVHLRPAAATHMKSRTPDSCSVSTDELYDTHSPYPEPLDFLDKAPALEQNQLMTTPATIMNVAHHTQPNAAAYAFNQISPRRLNINAAIQKSTLWYHVGLRFLKQHTFFTPSRAHLWTPAKYRQDIIDVIQLYYNDADMSYELPTVLAPAPKARKMITQQRRDLTALFRLPAKPKYVTRFIRAMARPPKNPLTHLYYTLIPRRLLTTIGLAKKRIPKAWTPHMQLQLAPQCFAINWAYIMHYIPATTPNTPANDHSNLNGNMLQAEPDNPSDDNPDYEYPAPTTAELARYDIARRLEIDFTALTNTLLPKPTSTMYDWYGGILLIHWNFMHVYNWKYYY